MFLDRDSATHSNLGGYYEGDPSLVFSDVFPYYNKTIDLKVTNMTSYPVEPVDLRHNGMQGLRGTIAMPPNHATEFQFELIDHDKGAPLAKEDTFPFWFSMLNLGVDPVGEGKQAFHMPSQFIVDSYTVASNYLDVSPDTWAGQAYLPPEEVAASSEDDDDALSHPMSMGERERHNTVAIMVDQPSWRARLMVVGGNNTMDFSFVGCSSMVCPSRQRCSKHKCPSGYELKPKARHHVCRESICAAGADDTQCCQPVGCNEPNILSFHEPTQLSNLGGKGPAEVSGDTLSPVLVYNNVFPGGNSSVDLEVSVVDEYYPFNASHNGLLGEFGQLNVRSGSSTTLKFRLYKNATHEAFEPEPFFFSVFDIDQGASGAVEQISVKGFNWYQIGEMSEVQVTLPSETESGSLETKEGTASFGSSSWGTYRDNPRHPLALTHLQLNRSVTFMMPSVSEFEMVISVGPGLAGRNILFGGASSLTCKARALCVEHTCPPSYTLRADPHLHVCSGESCSKDDTAHCCEVMAHHPLLDPADIPPPIPDSGNLIHLARKKTRSKLRRSKRSKGHRFDVSGI